MNRKRRSALILALALLAGVALVVATGADLLNASAPLLAGGSPAVVAYQGEIRVAGAPYTGDGYFKFAILDATGNTTHWSNDGTSTAGLPTAVAVKLPVSNGLFSILLGDTALDGMTQALAAGVFDQPDRTLRVWFSTSEGGPFEQLAPDTRVAAVPYALQAQEAVDAHTVDGLHASELGSHYQHVVVVAKSGGDYTSVQAAIDSIADAAAGNAYLVWVAPGVYKEQVTMKPYVHLQGAGQEATIISSTASSSDWPPTQATLVLASNTSLRDLTVGNSGASDSSAALLATAGMTRTLVADVTARAQGGGVNNYAIVLSGSGTGIKLQQVIALAENSSDHNIGLVNVSGAAAVLRGGAFTARGGEKAWAVFASKSGTTLEAEGVSMLAENASKNNTAMYPYDGAEVVLRGGDFTARGGDQTNAVADQLNSTVTAYDVTALAENGTDNYGLGSYDGSSMTVRGATVTARGGSYCNAVGTSWNDSTLDAESVVGLAENCSSENYGLYVGADTAHATVRGGSFTGRGGDDARGIISEESNITLYAENVTALGENGGAINCGLSNDLGAMAALRGGSFTGRGGALARGILNDGDDTTLNAEGVTALGENGSDANYGLWNSAGAATLHGGSFTARGGTYAYGIYTFGNSATLETESVTALAEDGTNASYGLLNSGGTATLHGGSFTARGGGSAAGISTGSGNARLKAVSVTALGEDGVHNNNGLTNGVGTATIHGGSFTGRGGTTARGICNANNGTTIKVVSITALGEDGGSKNYGFHNFTDAMADVAQSVLEGATYSVLHSSGAITVSNSLLVGNVVSGTVTCVAVSRGSTFNANGCP